jgi:hypothetical protein
VLLDHVIELGFCSFDLSVELIGFLLERGKAALLFIQLLCVAL